MWKWAFATGRFGFAPGSARLLQPLFTAAYGDPEPSLERIQDALSTFLRCMVSCHSPADEAFAEAMDEFWDPWGVQRNPHPQRPFLPRKTRVRTFPWQGPMRQLPRRPAFQWLGNGFRRHRFRRQHRRTRPQRINNFGVFWCWGPTAMKVPSSAKCGTHRTLHARWPFSKPSTRFWTTTAMASKTFPPLTAD